MLDDDQKASEVFFAISGNYAKFVPIAALSIIENTKSDIHFHVIHVGLDPVDEMKITDFIHQFGHASVEFLDATCEMARFDGLNLGWFRTSIAFSRFLIPQFSQKSKAIYLDVDLLIRYDLQKLWKLDLGPYAVAAARDIGLPPNHEGFFKKIETSPDHVYFNNGLLVMDCSKWRQEGITNGIVRIAREKSAEIKCPTQDPMNLYFEKNYLRLEDSCNISPQALFHEKQFDLKGKGVHYYGIGLNKPWYDSTVFGAEVFWELARRTPYYEVFLQEMMQRAAGSARSQMNDLANLDLKLQRDMAELQQLVSKVDRCGLSWRCRRLTEALFYEKQIDEQGVKRKFKLFGIGVYSCRKAADRNTVRILGIKIAYQNRPATKALQIHDKKTE
ncbi:MAG: glycosyltransferase family 8 protein [Verrucomicrobiales bacterium]|nr:glycosyltransferase family 8 protein [Verrucomicrobiales bacterium]